MDVFQSITQSSPLRGRKMIMKIHNNFIIFAKTGLFECFYHNSILFIIMNVLVQIPSSARITTISYIFILAEGLWAVWSF